MKQICKIAVVLVMSLFCSTQTWSQPVAFEKYGFEYIVDFNGFDWQKSEVLSVSVILNHVAEEELVYPSYIWKNGRTFTIDIVSGPESPFIEGCGKKGSYENVRKIKLPVNLDVISVLAFKNATNLAEINIPPRVTKIGRSAFEGCEKLEDITLPDSLRYIGSQAFYGCPALKEVVLPAKLSELGGGAFAGCNNLSSITIAPGNENFQSPSGSNVVLNRDGTTLFVAWGNSKIPPTVKKIENLTYHGFSTLTSIDIPQGVEIIGYEAFADCENLKTVNFQSDAALSSLGESAFSNCPALESILLPAGLRSIEFKTFEGCLSLKKVNFEPNAVLSSVVESAFSNCTSLESIDLPASVRSIGSYAFEGCRGLKSITLPDSVKQFGKERMFKGCYLLQSVELPKGVTEIGRETFQDCWSLASASLPEGVKTIKEDAFSKCGKLKTINSPSTLSTIEERAFYLCASLDSIDLSMLNKIKSKAFAYCSNLRAVSLPIATKWIYGDYMFKNCTGLKRIYNPQKMPKDIDPNVFEGVNQGECELYVPLESVELYKIAPVWSKFIVKGMDMSGIDDVPADRPAATPVARYNLQGSRLSGPQQGINIVRYSDGTTKKVLVE